MDFLSFGMSVEAAVVGSRSEDGGFSLASGVDTCEWGIDGSKVARWAVEGRGVDWEDDGEEDGTAPAVSGGRDGGML